MNGWKRTAGLQQLRSGRAVDGTVDAAATERRFVGCIDDRIDLQLGDVTPCDFDLAQLILPRSCEGVGFSLLTLND